MDVSLIFALIAIGLLLIVVSVQRNTIGIYRKLAKHDAQTIDRMGYEVKRWKDLYRKEVGKIADNMHNNEKPAI